MNGLSLLLALTSVGMTAAWWRTEAQLDRAHRSLDRARYRVAQDRLRMRQLAAERDRALDHADEVTALLVSQQGTHLHLVKELDA